MFNKQPLSIDQQVSLLIKRGLIVPDSEVDDLKKWLANVNYYKLSGYWMLYEELSQNSEPRFHRFKENTNWKLIKHTYIFDQKFRRLISTAIEKIEVSVKAHWSQYLAMTYGTHAHENRMIFDDIIFKGYCNKKSTYSKLLINYQKSNALYAKHYRTKYPELSSPPIWIVALIVTFGELINWIKYLKQAQDRQAILSIYGFDEQIMISFLTHLIEIRNICAHNGRLWNRRTNKSFIIPKKLIEKFAVVKDDTSTRKIYYTILMMGEVLKYIDPSYPFIKFVKTMITNNYLINPRHMGFPENWLEVSPWKNN